jgi:hypothetical protein
VVRDNLIGACLVGVRQVHNYLKSSQHMPNLQGVKPATNAILQRAMVSPLAAVTITAGEL